MLVEQFLHIMLNQDNPRFLFFFFDRSLSPLNNARFSMSYAVLNLTFLRLPL